MDLPIGVRFTIKNELTGRYLCDHSFYGLTAEKTLNSDIDFLWYLEEYKGQYYIRNAKGEDKPEDEKINHMIKYSVITLPNPTVFSTIDRDIVYTMNPTKSRFIGMLPGHGQLSNNEWNHRWIITTDGKGRYILKNYKNYLITDTGKGFIPSISKENNPEAGANKWYFDFKDVEFIDIDYERPIVKHGADHGTTYSTESLIKNGTSHTQEESHEITETKSTKISLTHTAGISISIESDLKAGIPVIGEGKMKTKVSAEYKFTFGKEDTITVSKKITRKITAPANTNINAVMTTQKKNFDIPYTVRLKCKRTGKELISRGICHSTESSVSFFELEETPFVSRSKL